MPTCPWNNDSQATFRWSWDGVKAQQCWPLVKPVHYKAPPKKNTCVPKPRDFLSFPWNPCESAPFSTFFQLFGISSSFSAPWAGMGLQRRLATCRTAAWCHETMRGTSAPRRCSQHDRIGPEIVGDLRDVNSKQRPGTSRSIKETSRKPAVSNWKKIFLVFKHYGLHVLSQMVQNEMKI